MSRNRTALLVGLLAGALSAVAARFSLFLPADAAWFGFLARAGLPSPLSDLPDWAGPAAACLAGVGAALFHLHYPRPLAALIVLLLAALEIFSGSAVAALFGTAFEPSAPAAALLLAALFAAAAARSVPAKREELLLSAFGGSVSLSTRARLARARLDPAEPKPFDAGFVACRACNLRPMLDALPPADAASALRLVLGRAAEAAREAGGAVAWCGSAGFDAVFGVDGAEEAAAPRTAKFLLSLADQLREWNAECGRLFGHSIDVRIGAETGPALPFLDAVPAGRARFASDTGLVAERICAANLEYGSTVAVGPRLQGAAAAVIEVRPLDFLPVGEGGSPEEIYEVITRAGGLDPDQTARRDAYWRGVVLFRQGRFDEAIRAFEEAAVPGSNDPPLAFYLQRAIRARSELPAAAAPPVLRVS